MSDDISRSDPLAPPETPAPASGRKAPVPKRKKPGPYRVPPREQRHGLFIVNTGDGKGKTTAALGLLLRARGREMRVAMYQFVKRLTDAGEHRAAARLGLEIVALGAGGLADDATLARDGWQRCKRDHRGGNVRRARARRAHAARGVGLDRRRRKWWTRSRRGRVARTWSSPDDTPRANFSRPPTS